MLRRVQTLNYGCLRHVDVELNPFQVLVGPNGSGKSTLFDVVEFVRDVAVEGVRRAVERRTNNLQDLVWGRPKHDPWFELALEYDLPPVDANPDELDGLVGRVELSVGGDGGDPESIAQGMFVARRSGRRKRAASMTIPRSILTRGIGIAAPPEAQRRWMYALAERGEPASHVESRDNLPFVETHQAGCRRLGLAPDRLRRASPPVARMEPLEPDGSNLPWAVKRLRDADQDQFRAWLAHLRTVLRDLEDIRVVDREDDRHAYLMLRYGNGVEVPSWSVSEGTLRLLALTLIAYLPDEDCTYLVEEPENGIHPRAVEAVYQSLSSAYESQILLASHSPELLICARPFDVLCFDRDENGATRVTPGDRHPRLKTWRNAADVDLFFAPDILG